MFGFCYSWVEGTKAIFFWKFKSPRFGGRAMRKNQDIRKLLESKRVHHYEVAAEMGVDRTTFSRWMQKEMSAERKDSIREAVKKVLSVDE